MRCFLDAVQTQRNAEQVSWHSWATERQMMRKRYDKEFSEDLFICNLVKGLTRACVKVKWIVLEQDWVREESIQRRL